MKFVKKTEYLTIQISRGKTWRLIYMLCIISAIISMFLDNVTTILLMTPITIKIFECLGLNPIPVLPFIILNINIAGLTTLIGHPPNLLITSDSYISKQNVTFLAFSMHMSVGVLIALIQTNIQLRIQNRDIQKRLRQNKSSDELIAWKNCLTSIQTSAETTKMEFLKMILVEKIKSLEASPINMISDKKTFQKTLRILKKTVNFIIRF